MEAKVYTPNDGASYRELLREKYGTHTNFEYFLHDATVAYAFCTESENVLFTPICLWKEGVVIGHIALIRDKRLSTGEAFFGFLETPNNQDAFALLWEALVREARAEGIRVLKGPVNGSIWHSYRCIKESDGQESFTTEPITEDYYYDLLLLNQPSFEACYFSAYRTRYDTVLALLGAASYSRLALSGFSILPATTVTVEHMREIAEISKQTFSASWGYTELTEREFLQLYSSEKMSAHLDTLYLLYKEERLIGFLSTGREDAATLICKTICILPEFQGRGLGNALAYKVHQDAIAAGVTKIIYALIREGNDVKKFPKDHAVIFRKYAAFEFTL